MITRARLAVALTGLALVGSALPGGGAGLAAAEGPVEDARQAARRVPFTARVEVSWVDQEGFHTAELTVRAVGGRISIQTAGEGGSSTTVRRDTDTAGQEAGGLLTPAVERKYQLVRRDGPEVAGRATDEVVLRSGGLVRERLAVDKATGLVLQREVFGEGGRPVRVVRVLQLDTAPVPDEAVPGQAGSNAPKALEVSRLPSVYPAPAALAGGYRRLAAYRHSQVVHLLYTDGFHGLSLFSQPGDLVTRSLPRGGQVVRVGKAQGIRYTWPGGEVLTWQSGPMVHTLVGDASADDMLVAARSLPRPGRPSLLGRLLGTARVVGELVSGGR
ncbi:MAG: hypothetical protein ACRD0N_08675 [Acidimicrobiales bacterium]